MKQFKEVVDKDMIKLTKGLTLLFILFLAVGCNSTQSADVNTTNPTDSNISIADDGNTLEQDSETQSIKVGSFVSGEHPTQGTVRLVSEGENTLIKLDSDFTTSELGPDLVVILHRSDDVIGSTVPPAYPINEGDYVVIAPLSKYSGIQEYLIPDEIDATEYKSVAIWCRKFNATFGAAVLQ